MTIISKIKNTKVVTNQGLLLAALAVAVMAPDMANATVTTFSAALCSALTYITGQVGGAIATLAIIALGIGAMLGKIAWTTVIICCCGIAAVFGAAEIVQTISGGATC
jgi:type IV secretion system protein VirB2